MKKSRKVTLRDFFNIEQSITLGTMIVFVFQSKCVNNRFEISYFQGSTTDQSTIHIRVCK